MSDVIVILKLKNTLYVLCRLKTEEAIWKFYLRPSAVDAIVLIHRRDIFGPNLVLARLEKGNSNNCSSDYWTSSTFKKMATTHFKHVKPFPTLLPVKYSPDLSLNLICFYVVEFFARKKKKAHSEIRLGEANLWPSSEPQNLTMPVLNLKIWRKCK